MITNQASTPSVASSATSVNLLPANAYRTGVAVFNESTSTLFLKCGPIASATNYTVAILPSGYYELPRLAGGLFCYTGPIDGIWSSANGSARITEFTTTNSLIER